MTPRHHLIPEAYLRHFAKAKPGRKFPVVTLVDRDDLSRKILKSVDKACTEVGFYRIETDDLAQEEDRQAHEPELVENHLSHFEGEGLKVVDKFTRELSLASMTQEDWYHLINYIALQAVRGHRWREDLNALATHSARQFLRETVSDSEIRDWLVERGQQPTRANVLAYRREMTSDAGPRLIAPQSVLVQESIRMAFTQINERLADRMEWSLIVGVPGSVLTSDEPVVWWSPGADPVGFGSAWVMWLPLSDRTILQLRDTAVDEEELGLPKQTTQEDLDSLIQLINLEVASQATRWIIHHPDAKPLDGMDLPARTEWKTQLVGQSVDGNVVREQYVFRRLPRLED